MNEEKELQINDPVEITYENVGTPGHVDHNKPRDPSMIELVMIEVKRLASISKIYQHHIKESKTKPKQDLYSKKLRKNNKQLADMLVRLERLNEIENNKEESDD